MAEVYTIAGPPPGALGATECPPGWTVTPNGNCGGPPPKYFKAEAAALQRALNAKGAALRVDGIIGPLTVGAVNRALGKSMAIESVTANVINLTSAVQAAPAGRGAGPVGPLPMSEGISPWLWALLGFDLLAVGLGTYGLMTRDRDAGGNVIEFPRRRAA